MKITAKQIFTKQNILVMAIPIAIVAIFCIVTFINPSSTSTQQREVGSISDEFTDKFATTNKLPHINDINVDTQPLLWDFVYGTPDWHNKDLITNQNTIYTFCYDKKQDSYFMSCRPQYEGDGYNGEPIFASKPVEVINNNAKLEKAFAQSQTYTEGDYVFAYVDMSRGDYVTDFSAYNSSAYNTSNNTWGGVSLNDSYNISIDSSSDSVKYTQGYVEYLQGRGYRTDYLRTSYAQLLLDNAGIDINDNVYNMANYKSYIKVKSTDGKKDLIVTPNTGIGYNYDTNTDGTVNNYTDYSISGFIDVNQDQPLLFGLANIEEDDKTLTDAGYETIESALDNPIYVPIADVNSY